MLAKRFLICAVVLSTLLATLAATTVGAAGGDKKKPEKKKEVWTDASDPTLPADFKFQGEYVGDEIGCQVIALGGGTFQAVLCKRGLPGAGWDGLAKALLDGKLEDDKVVFVPTAGKRKYLAQSPLEFSATVKFPPPGQKDFRGTIIGDTLTVNYGIKNALVMKKTIRKSPSIAAKAPDGAVVLFEGSSKDEWNGGRVDKKTGFLNTDGGEVTTKRKFSNYTAHVEFLLPYRPDARGQGRGNSGFYQVDHYEVQILDSFGLEGMNNECGGVYSLVKPSVNMCLPPLQWQTYDVDFTNAVRDDTGKKIKNSRLTVKLNGVVIHDNVELKGVTGGARMEPEGTPGLLRLQGHGNPLQFKNIWVVVERK
ncbi:MAG: DUF1080 domain-containing protein [Gemmataceae bacterium]|nr:DUF1080 domain-containing protein [Gemmataceae bacterium]